MLVQRLLLLIAVAALGLSGCSLERIASGDTIRVVIGYQSKTINTVTAGTLLRAQGYLEQRLNQITDNGGPKYQVEWQDYDTGAPITAQMIAEKIDIGSMGDYPLLINGSRSQSGAKAGTELVSVTGYSNTGALNMVVVPPNSAARSLSDLRGNTVSASVGSAGHGTLVQALDRAGIDPEDVDVLNQQPQVGASALESGQVSALSQFVAWPGLLVFQDKAELLYDGAELNLPTFHGVVARPAYTDEHPEVLDAFLQAQLDATRFLRDRPVEAAQVVARDSGLPPEVVYLYNGPGGTSFDTTLKPELIAALDHDTQYLKSIGKFDDIDLDEFVADEAIRKAFADRGGSDYEAALADTTNRTSGSPIEYWLDGEETTRPVGNANELLRAIKTARVAGKTVRTAYVRGNELGTRWFADKAVWLRDADTFLAFTTTAAATRHRQAHPTAVPVTYDQAIAEVDA